MKKFMCNDTPGQDDVLTADSPKMASHNFDEQSDSDINLASVVSVQVGKTVELTKSEMLRLEKIIVKSYKIWSGRNVRNILEAVFLLL